MATDTREGRTSHYSKQSPWIGENKLSQVLFTSAITLELTLALTKLLTRHKNFADSAKFTVLIDQSARDLYFLPTSSGPQVPLLGL